MMSMLRASGCMRDLDDLNVPYHLEFVGFSLAVVPATGVRLGAVSSTPRRRKEHCLCFARMS